MPDHPVAPARAPAPPAGPAGSALERAVASSPAPFALADATAPGHPLLWANAAFARLVGRPAGDLVGTPSADFGPAVVASPVRDDAGGVTHLALTPAPTATSATPGTQAPRVTPVDDADHARIALGVLERVGGDLSASLDVDEALRRVVDAVVPALADWCAIDLVEGDEPLPQDTPDAPDVVNEVERRRVRTAVAHRDPDREALVWRMAELDARQPGASVVPTSLLSGQSLLMERLTPEATAARTGGDPELAEIFARLDNRAGAVVALRARGRVIGALTLSVTGESGRPFGRRELAVAEILAARAALAVDNARLFAAETAGRQRAAALAEAGLALSGSLRSSEVVDVLLRLVVPQVGDWAFVQLTGPAAGDADPDAALVVAASRHVDQAEQARRHGLLNGLRMRSGGPGPATVLATSRTQLVRAVDDGYLASLLADRPDALEAVRSFQVISSVHVPLTTGRRTFGVLSVTRGTGRPFSDGDARFLTELGRRAALALANAGAFEAEQVVALELQRSLLPASLPAVPGLRVAGRYLAGGSGVLVGGDWYDVVPLPDGRVGLCVGDVMGRGLQAAAVMGQLRAALRSHAVEGLPPREVLSRLGVFTRMLDGEHLVTCLYALHDPEAGVTTIASAGHPPPLLMPADGHGARYVDVLPGVPLGVDDLSSGYADTTVRLGAGDCLLLFTDGLVEDRTMPLGDGMDRLATGLGAVLPASAEAVCAAALRVMGRDRSHDDDTAVLAVLAVGGAGGRPPGARRTRVRLSAQPQSVAAARRHVTGTLTRWGATDVVETAALLVSELVSNAVRHGHGPIDVRLDDGPDGLLVRIADASPVLPVRQAPLVPQGVPDPDDALGISESGRGLRLVEALADEWGWTLRPDSGKDVWFRLTHATAVELVQKG